MAALLDKVPVFKKKVSSFLSKEDGKITQTQVMVLIKSRLLAMAEGNDKTSTDEVISLIEKLDFKLAESFLE